MTDLDLQSKFIDDCLVIIKQQVDDDPYIQIIITDHFLKYSDFNEYSIYMTEKYRNTINNKSLILLWNKTNKSSYTANTIKYLASRDKKSYNNIVKDYFLNNEYYDNIYKIIDCIYFVYGHIVAFSQNIWYKFDNNIWKKTNVTELNKILHNVVHDVFIKQEYFKKYPKICQNIFNIDKIIEAQMLFNSEVKSCVWDNDKQLIGFKNGIYDTRYEMFRKAYPEDYISLSVGYDYVNYSGNEYIFTEFDNILNNNFTDSESKKNYINLLKQCLFGHIKHINKPLLTVFNKLDSFQELLMQTTFGEYLYNADTNDPQNQNIFQGALIGKRILLSKNVNLSNHNYKSQYFIPNVNKDFLDNTLYARKLYQNHLIEYKRLFNIIVTSEDDINNSFNNSINLIEINNFNQINELYLLKYAEILIHILIKNKPKRLYKKIPSCYLDLYINCY